MYVVYFIFFLGLAIGSFLNVVIDRSPRGISIRGRSHCDSCKKNLAWLDLLPLVSFAILGGKCRFCRSPLSFQYPIVEGLTGIMFVAVLLFLFPNERIINSELGIIDFATLGFYLFILANLIAIFFIDLKYGIIPDILVFLSIALTFPYFLIIHNSLFLSHLLSAVGAFLLFLLIFVGTKGRGMGFGDVKLSFLMGLFLGFPKIIIALYVAFLTGAVVALILVIWGKKKFRGGTIPFGPFLVIGTVVALIFGEYILLQLPL